MFGLIMSQKQPIEMDTIKHQDDIEIGPPGSGLILEFLSKKIPKTNEEDLAWMIRVLISHMNFIALITENFSIKCSPRHDPRAPRTVLKTTS